MKNLADGTVNAAQVRKDDSGADEGDLKAMLSTNLLALRELATNMSNGIICRSRKIGLKTYRNVFLGEDAMQWLISHGSCIASTDVEATEWGQLMIDAGFVKPVSKPHENSPFGVTKVIRIFKGGKSMYQFDHLRISPFKLHIAVRKAVDLQSMDIFGRAPHPYVVLQLGEQYAETKTVNNSQLSPVWNEFCVFGVTSVEAEQLRVSVYDYDSLLSDRLVGYCQLGISDLPIFGEDANQKNFIDDMNVDLLNVSNSDDSEHTAGGISHVSLRSINEVTTTVEMKCDNYATVQDGEEEEEMSTDGLLDDHGKHEIDRSRSTSSSEHQLPEDRLTGMGEKCDTSFINRPAVRDVPDNTFSWLDLHGPGAIGREKCFGKIALEFWLTSVKPQTLEAHGVVPIRIFLKIFSVTGVKSIEERSPLPLQMFNAKTCVVARVGDEYSTSEYYRKSKSLRSDYGGEIISIEGRMNPTTDNLRISVHQTTMDIGDKSIASVQIPLSTIAMDCDDSEEDTPGTTKTSTLQLRALAGMLTARTINNGEICASLWMQRYFSSGDILGPEIIEDSNRIQGYDGPLPEQLENLCIDKEISCGFFRLRRALLGQDSELLSIHDEESGIIDRLKTEWVLPSGQPPNTFNNLEACERQESYIMPNVLYLPEVLCNATERVIMDTSDVCIWMVKIKTPEVPYGTLFTVTNQIILVRTRPNRVRIRISSDLEFTQEPFIANQIRNAAAKGAKESFIQLLTIIEASLLPAGQKKTRANRKTACDIEFPWIHTACFAFIIVAILCGMLFKFSPKPVEQA